MLNEILSGIPHRETVWQRPPSPPYAVYHEECTRRGHDFANCITEHSVTIELYAESPDIGDEAAIEERLDARGIQFDRLDREWLDTEQLYMTTYSFDYITKG